METDQLAFDAAISQTYATMHEYALGGVVSSPTPSTPAFLDFGREDAPDSDSGLLFADESTADQEVFVAIDQTLESAYSDWTQIRQQKTDGAIDESEQAQQQQQQQQQQPLAPAFSTAMTIASTDSNPSSEDEWTAQTQQRFDLVGMLAPMPHDTNAWDTIVNDDDGMFLPAMAMPASAAAIPFDGHFPQPSDGPFLTSSGNTPASITSFVSHPSTPAEQQPPAAAADADSRASSESVTASSGASEHSGPPKARLTKDVLIAAAASGLTRGQLVSKQACIPCRKLKVSCDNERPCSRCVKFCRDCVDRSEAEVADSKQRRKRRRKVDTEAAAAAGGGEEEEGAPAPAADASKPSRRRTVRQRALEPAAFLPSTPSATMTVRATSVLSSQLYSRSLLVILQTLGIRDALLRLCQQIETVPHLMKVVQFRDQTSLMASYLTDLLVPQDFEVFMQAGLTPSELESTTFTQCPLTAWIDPKRRPMHYVVQRGVVGLSAPEFVEAETAQFAFEWLPQAKTSFQMWRKLQAAKAEYEQQLRESKAARQRAAATTQPDQDAPMAQRHDSSSALSGLLSPSSSSTAAVGLSHDGVEHLTAHERARYLTRLAAGDASTGGVTGRRLDQPVPDEEDSVAALVDSMNCLAVGPLNEANCRNIDGVPVQPGHAKWCSRSERNLLDLAAAADGAAPAGGIIGAKHARVDGSACVHDGAASVASASNASENGLASFPSASPQQQLPACTCEQSMPLPVRITVNAAFTRLFGWTQAEIEQGVYEENMQFMRHLYPPSVWPAMQTVVATQMLGFANAISLTAARAAGQTQAAASGEGGAGGSMPSTPPTTSVPSRASAWVAPSGSGSSPPRSLSHLLHTQIVTKSGALFPALVVKKTLPGADTMVQGHLVEWQVKPFVANQGQGLVVPQPRE